MNSESVRMLHWDRLGSRGGKIPVGGVGIGLSLLVDVCDAWNRFGLCLLDFLWSVKVFFSTLNESRKENVMEA